MNEIFVRRSCLLSLDKYHAQYSLGPVVNILAIFSNANILKNKIKIYHIKGIGCPLLISINIDIFDQGTEK